MLFKRALILSLLFYFVSTIFGIAVALFIGIDIFSSSIFSEGYVFATFVFMILTSAIISLWYFNKPQIKSGALEGFYLGIIFCLTGAILDLIFFFVYNSESGGPFSLSSYFISGLFLISCLFIIVTTTIVGRVIEIKKLTK